MTISFIENTQNVYGYQLVSTNFTDREVFFTVTKSLDAQYCSVCGSKSVTATYIRNREIKALPSGALQTRIKVRMHRLKCHRCDSFRMERIDFTATTSSRTTECLNTFIIGIRKHMSVSAISRFYGLHWATIKDIEKKHLQETYSHIPLSEVRRIGIDEVFMGKSIGIKGFLTIVRDLDTGAVVFVGKGKKGECLDEFLVKLNSEKAKIEAVAVDLAPSFTSWIKRNLPNAVIVYDHFHVIKLMNDKLNAVRRKTMNLLNEEEKKYLKGRSWQYVMNKENLSPDIAADLKRNEHLFSDLGKAHWLKESLRNIYRLSGCSEFAKVAFKRWCEFALKSNISELKTMAKTIERHLDGIVAFWDTGLTSASMEGFNNKIGWLTRQAYGYRDEEYLILKIYGLPKLRLERRLA